MLPAQHECGLWTDPGPHLAIGCLEEASPDSMSLRAATRLARVQRFPALPDATTMVFGPNLQQHLQNP